jgi:hypothetical protein
VAPKAPLQVGDTALAGKLGIVAGHVGNAVVLDVEDVDDVELVEVVLLVEDVDDVEVVLLVGIVWHNSPLGTAAIERLQTNSRLMAQLASFQAPSLAFTPRTPI